jgi:NAD(P)-dependent dehydrogenase (short-subunit alcohol dehydrogenase family)
MGFQLKRIRLPSCAQARNIPRRFGARRISLNLETIDMLLKDKVAIITGGAGQNGLGFATACLMAMHGARVALLDLERADPRAAAARLGAGHLGIVADVTDKRSCDAAGDAVLQGFGRIDVLVNNAGIT